MSRPRVCASLIGGLLTVAGCSQRVPQPHVTILPPDLVLVSRVGSSAITPHPAGCPLQTYDRMPAGVRRDLGLIELAGSVPAGGDIFAAVDQKACESGADAIVIAQQEQRNLLDRTEYHVIAEAILTHPQAAVASPAPTPAESVEASGAAENSAAETKLAAQPAPSEVLMQPVGADANNQGDSNALPESSAMTESTIAATEAAPLAPAVDPSLTIAAAVASRAPIPSARATATTLLTATPSATPTPSAAATPTSSATPTPEANATDTATPIVTLTPVDTPTASPTDTPTPSVTATATASPTPTATPEQSPAPLEAAATPSPTLTPTAAPTTSSAISPTLENAPAAPAATPTSSPGFAASPDSESSPATSGD